MKFIYMILGIVFGIILTKSEVISWFRIHDMFLFKEAHMYLIIGSAILTGAASILILKKLSATKLITKDLNLKGKDEHKGTIIGGVIFGIGWAITGACPGPIFAQIGAGEYAAIVTLVGAVVGTAIYYSLKSKLPH